MTVPGSRSRALNDQPLRAAGDWVLWWCTAFRRLDSNFALDRAIEHARALKKPLVILEALRVGYEHASDRLHTFVLEGMRDNFAKSQSAPVTYLPYVERVAGEGRGLVEALAAQACVVVTDDWPSFFVPRMQAALAARIGVKCEAVDSNGLFPMHATTRVFTTAHSFRTYLQKELPKHLPHMPVEEPLKRLELPRLETLPKALARWPMATAAELKVPRVLAASLPIDHTVQPVALEGGASSANRRLTDFIRTKLTDYPEGRNEPEGDGTTKLSAALHFGHISSHEIFRAITRHERWDASSLGKSIGGAKAGWWQLSAPAEAFIDQLVTWRELAFNFAALRPTELASVDSLPGWARDTHRDHAKDVRPHRYTLEQLDHAQTHDPLWNATQMQLRRDGWFHGYLRMLWGKKILEWSASPAEALQRMEHLMNRYSLDGRDPVSYSGFMWVLGRYDRAWGPERPIFGKVRYMSSDNTARKVRVKSFIEQYAPRHQPGGR